MGLSVQVEKMYVWDNFIKKLVLKSEVVVQLVDSKRTVYVEEGPLYCETGQEIWEATQTLRKRLVTNLGKEYEEENTIFGT